MAGALGWFNLILILFMSSIFPIKRLYQKYKNRRVLKLYKRVRLLHPMIGTVIIIFGIIHGYMKLNVLRLHTGTIVLLIVILMGVIAVIGPRVKILRKKWHYIHKNIAILLWVSVLVHLFYSSLI